MTPVKIVADSGCDLPRSLSRRHGITLVPLVVQIGGDSYYHGEFDPELLWRRLPHERASTSGPPLGRFRQAFERLVRAGDEVVCITLTSKHSGTFNTAWAAAQEFGGRVRVVDSQSISLGMGVLVLAAAMAAQAGRAADEVVRLVEDIRARTQVRLVLDTLEYVRRGGRLARLMQVIDRMCRSFDIKPILGIVEGELRLVGAARTLRGALRRIEGESARWAPIERIAVAHTRLHALGEETAQRLAARFALMRERILVAEAGPVFAVHAGPGALGIVVVSKARGDPSSADGGIQQ